MTAPPTSDRRTSCTWRPVKRPSGTCYDVVSENGIRVTPWPIAKLCHAKVLGVLVAGVADDTDATTDHGKQTILRVLAITRSFLDFEASDRRSRNFPEAVTAWNAYVARTRVMVAPNGMPEAMPADSTMLGWTDLPGILPTIAEGGAP